MRRPLTDGEAIDGEGISFLARDGIAGFRQKIRLFARKKAD